MISIVICSISKKLREELAVNIEKTIGVEFEVIIIDNSEANYSICKVYNIGAGKARFPYLCFVHEDIIFETRDWGIKFLSHLQNPETGLIGVAGSSYKASVPSSWSCPQSQATTHVVQYGHGDDQSPVHVQPENISKKPYEAVVVDGLFFGTRKDVWELHTFDEELLKGFHGYDIDFSLQVTRTHKVYVVYDIVINHFSPGNQTQSWLDNAVLISRKWKSYLPLSVQVLSYAEQKRCFYEPFHYFVWKMKNVRYSFFKRLWLIVYFMRLKYWDSAELYKLFRKIR
jgi:hypothetical protein